MGYEICAHYFMPVALTTLLTRFDLYIISSIYNDIFAKKFYAAFHRILDLICTISMEMISMKVTLP